jgi:ferrochelatase
MRAQLTLRVSPYYDDPDYIEALAVLIDTHLKSCLSARVDCHVLPRHATKYVDRMIPIFHSASHNGRVRCGWALMPQS